MNLSEFVKTGKEIRAPRMLLYGLPKVGKSTFGAAFPNHIIINMEDSLDNISCTKTPLLTSDSQVMTILKQLYTEEHNYKTLVVDTIDWLEKVICENVAESQGKNTVEEIGFGKGYPLVVNRWGAFLKVFDLLRNERGMTILLLSHAEVKKYTPPIGEEYDMYTPKLYGKKDKTQTSLALLMEYADVIMFANQKTLTKEVGDGFNKRTQAVANTESFLYTASSYPGFVSGNRYNLKPEIKLDYTEFSDDFLAKTGFSFGNVSTTNKKEVKKNV